MSSKKSTEKPDTESELGVGAAASPPPHMGKSGQSTTTGRKTTNVSEREEAAWRGLEALRRSPPEDFGDD